jgi:aspartate beta-hydroxylase
MHLPGLRSLPLWTSFDGTSNRIAFQDPMLTHVVEYLEKNVPIFKQEYELQKSLVSSDYTSGGVHGKKLHSGSWDWHSYMMQGRVQYRFVEHFPESSRVLHGLRDDQLLFEGTPFGFCFFSSLHPKSSIQAHTGPMNFRLRLHLPLIVPEKCGIRVGPTSQEWKEGVALVLDDSYQHEVWNDSDETRVLLLVDVWHPDVKPQEKEEIVAMFQHAQDQGWLKG